ncbi:MAG TPA: endospore germination permease [Bacillota bacterium]|nr:endospore germination permease [Bacillota bacterium]
MSEEIISHRQLFFIIYIMRTFVVISYMPTLTSGEALQDAWLSTLVALLFALPQVWLIAAMGAGFPGETVFQYGPRLLGPWLGRLVTIPFLWHFLWIASLELRLYAEVVATAFMVETPIIVVVLSMVIVAAVAAAAGIEVVGRLVDLLFPLFLLTIVFALIFPLIKADFANLLPVLDRGWGPVLSSTIIPTVMTSQIMVLLVIMSSLNRPQKFVAKALGALALSYTTLLVGVILVISTLGAEEGARSLFPFFRMVRSISVGGFLQRVEALNIIPWGLGIYIALSVNLWSGSRGVQQILNLKGYRPLIPPMAVIWVILSIHGFDDVFQLKRIILPKYAIPVNALSSLVPLLVLWAARIGQNIRRWRTEGRRK